MWIEGTIGAYTYSAKVYGRGSVFGIDGGRISKLSIRKSGKIVYNYDRGLDFDNLDTEGRSVYDEILAKYKEEV